MLVLHRRDERHNLCVLRHIVVLIGVVLFVGTSTYIGEYLLVFSNINT